MRFLRSRLGRAALGLLISAIAIALVVRSVDVAAGVADAQDRAAGAGSLVLLGLVIARRAAARRPLARAAGAARPRAVPHDPRVAPRRLPRQQRAAGAARRGRPGHDLGGRTTLSRSDDPRARSSSSGSSTRSWSSPSPRSRSSCCPCAGIVASAVLAGLAVTALLVVGVAAGIAAHRLPGRRPRGRVPRALAAGASGPRPAARGPRGRERRAHGRAGGRALDRVVVVHGARVRGRRAGRRRGADASARRRSSPRARTSRPRSRPAPGTSARSSSRRSTIATSVGIDRESALAFALLVHVATLLVTSVGGAIVLIFGGRHQAPSPEPSVGAAGVAAPRRLFHDDIRGR